MANKHKFHYHDHYAYPEGFHINVSIHNYKHNGKQVHRPMSLVEADLCLHIQRPGLSGVNCPECQFDQ